MPQAALEHKKAAAAAAALQTVTKRGVKIE